MLKYTKIFLIVCLALIVSACGNSSEGSSGNIPNDSSQTNDKKVTLTYAFFAAENTYPATIAKKWAEAVEERTNGQVEVKFFFGGSLLNAGNMLDGVYNNVADIGLTATSYEPGRYPLLEISDLPSGYPNATVASQVVSDLVKEFPPEPFEGFKVLKVFTTEPLYIHSKEPISSLEELRGQQLRIGGALTHMMQALGAAPVGMSQAEMAEALQTGIISGYVSERALLKDGGFADLVNYYTDYPFGVVTLAAVMNEDIWNSLPADIQEVMEQLYQEMPLVAGQYMDNHVLDVIEWSKAEHGLDVISLTAEEKSRWDAIIQPLQDEAVKAVETNGLPGNKFKERLYELIEKYSK